MAFDADTARDTIARYLGFSDKGTSGNQVSDLVVEELKSVDVSLEYLIACDHETKKSVINDILRRITKTDDINGIPVTVIQMKLVVELEKEKDGRIKAKAEAEAKAKEEEKANIQEEQQAPDFQIKIHLNGKELTENGYSKGDVDLTLKMLRIEPKLKEALFYDCNDNLLRTNQDFKRAKENVFARVPGLQTFDWYFAKGNRAKKNGRLILYDESIQDFGESAQLACNIVAPTFTQFVTGLSRPHKGLTIVAVLVVVMFCFFAAKMELSASAAVLVSVFSTSVSVGTKLCSTGGGQIRADKILCITSDYGCYMFANGNWPPPDQQRKLMKDVIDDHYARIQDLLMVYYVVDTLYSGISYVCDYWWVVDILVLFTFHIVYVFAFYYQNKEQLVTQKLVSLKQKFVSLKQSCNCRNLFGTQISDNYRPLAGE